MEDKNLTGLGITAKEHPRWYEPASLIFATIMCVLGAIIGMVILKKTSTSLAPSTWADSYSEEEIPCRPDRKMMICTPLEMMMS